MVVAVVVGGGGGVRLILHGNVTAVQCGKMSLRYSVGKCHCVTVWENVTVLHYGK